MGINLIAMTVRVPRLGHARGVCMSCA
jgi:hypothetical protein